MCELNAAKNSVRTHSEYLNIWVFTKAAFWKRLPKLRPADYSPKTVGSIVVALERDTIVWGIKLESSEVFTSSTLLYVGT